MVATTRPETMLGDTGVAVSPKDARQGDARGQDGEAAASSTARSPSSADFHVDAEFGTGFVKVTPAHDPNDCGDGRAPRACTQVNIFDEHARTWSRATAQFSGMTPRASAREAVVARFEEHGAARPRGGPRPFGHARATAATPRSSRGCPSSGSWPSTALKGRRVQRGRGRRGHVPPRALDAGLSHLDGQPQGLVHLAPAVVGPPHPDVLLRRMRLGTTRAWRTSDTCPKCGAHAAPGRGRARHAGSRQPAVDVRHAWAGPKPGSGCADRAGTIPRTALVDRARHHARCGWRAWSWRRRTSARRSRSMTWSFIRNDPGEGRHAACPSRKRQRRRPYATSSTTYGADAHALQPAHAGDQQHRTCASTPTSTRRRTSSSAAPAPSRRARSSTKICNASALRVDATSMASSRASPMARTPGRRVDTLSRLARLVAVR